jgi:hypothetical protein
MARTNVKSHQTDILIRAIKGGYLFAEVPYQLGARDNGVSKAVTFPSLIRVVTGYVRLFFDIHFEKNKGKKKLAPGSQSYRRNSPTNEQQRRMEFVAMSPGEGTGVSQSRPRMVEIGEGRDLFTGDVGF